MADLATETGKYVGQSYLAIADALVGEALSRQYPFVQSAVQDKIQTDAKIDAALSNGATAVYNFVSDAGLHMLDTAFFHTLSESSQTFRDANANLYARETKVVNWATNYFSNTGNAYSSANFVDLSKNAKDVIDIASSVTGIGAINKVNNAKKAAEAAHKLENIVADMKRLDDLSLLDPARAVVFVKEMPSPLSFNQNIQPLLKEVNLTMDEFQALKLSRIEDITDIQAEKIKFIRDQVPLITSETPLYKVIPAENIPKIMSGKYDSKVGGYIAKAEDVKHIKSYGEILESIRLDYKGTPFTENLNTYGLIKFKSTISAKIEIPYGERLGGTITDASPATKNGFLASRNGEVIPEWYSPKEFPQDGTELYRVTNGVAELIGRYIKEAGTKNGRYYSIGEQK